MKAIRTNKLALRMIVLAIAAASTATILAQGRPREVGLRNATPG
jgi:hypothetical protein